MNPESAMPSRRLISAVAIFVQLSMSVIVGQPEKGKSPDHYVKKQTWHGTMLASREAFEGWLSAQQVRQGPWYMSNLKLAEITDEIFLAETPDPLARSADGVPLWNVLTRPKDDRRYALIPGKGSDLVYFVSELYSDRDDVIVAEIGCSRDVEVYLNGHKIADRKRLSMSGKDKLELSLVAGQNVVLLKAFNENPRIIDFVFALRRNPAVDIWKKLEADFPLESARLEYDLGEGGYLDWFEQSGSVALERQFIEDTLKGIDVSSDSGIYREFDDLFMPEQDGRNSRFLAFYEKACRVRRLSMDLKRVNFRALRMAIRNMAKEFGSEYPDSEGFLKRVDQEARRLGEVERQLASGSESDLRKVEAYCQGLLGLQQEALLSNPLLDFDQLLLIKRVPSGNPYWFQEASRGTGKYIGLPQQSSWQLHKMSNLFDWENEVVSLSPVRPEGHLSTVFAPKTDRLVTDMDLNFDGRRLLITMPDDDGMWQLSEIDLLSQKVRQLTGDAPDVHSLDGCYLPNGQIAYVSTACFQGVPCNSGVNVGMLYLMNSDGGDVRQLCFEQDHNFCPTVMNDGRILYLRWEYTDIPHVWARYLFTMNPDGTGQRPYYGTGSYWPNAIFYARPVPGHPTKVAGIVTGHHVGRIGDLVVFDPAQSRYSSEGAVQRIPGYGEKVEPVVADKLTDTTYPKFLHPLPLSEEYFLVSCRPTHEDLWGIYLVDTFDNMTLIKEVDGHALLEPIPLRSVATPPVVPDTVDLKKKDAIVYVEDVYAGRGLKGVPRGVVKNLRLFTYHFAYRTVAGITHRVGADGPWEPKRILGTVPVEEDGSALFRIPANMPISIQPLDKGGKALQLMRSWMTAMPGEIVSCVGCHEEANSSPLSQDRRIALTKSPEDIRPWYGPVRGFSFVREVQPVLDRYCVGCHGGDRGASPDLRGDQGKFIAFRRGVPEPIVVHDAQREKLVTNYGGVFPPAYIELRRYIRVGGLESDLRTLNPGEFHADNTELFQILNKGHFGVELDSEAIERIAAWIDLNAPCHGTWEEVVGARKIAGDHRRREDLRQKYAGLNNDYEVILNSTREPLVPVIPKPMPERDVNVPLVQEWPFDGSEARSRQMRSGQPTRKLGLCGGETLELVYVPAGQFVMGDPAGENDELPMTRQTMDQPFWISRFEITNQQYACFDSSHDSRYEHKGSWMFEEWDLGWNLNGQNQPVVRVSQQEATAFSEWLSERIGEEVGLPTEAQWEYACRAGSDEAFSFGPKDTDFSPFANMADWTIRDLAYDVRDNYPPDLVPRDARFNDRLLVTGDVGQFEPNSWGIHDMHGNVWEWTRTKYASYPYDENDGRNSDIGPGSSVVVRGGSWYDRPVRGRASFRLSYPAWRKVHNIGFRVVIPAESQLRVAER